MYKIPRMIINNSIMCHATEEEEDQFRLHSDAGKDLISRKKNWFSPFF